MNVSEKRLGVRVDAGEIKVGQLADDFRHRTEDALELDHLASHPEDSPDLLALQERDQYVLL
ncbi:hypothetical protein D3C80_1858950 [compost metagenome]